ncbi:MAG: class A beta-lactamase [Hyphomonadaceae bacterium]
MRSRRETLLGALAIGACAPVADVAPPLNDSRFAGIEARIGGRVGVAAWNTGTGAWLAHRRHERFAMCSTFKWALAAAQLRLAQDGGPQLGDQLRFDRSDMLSYAPVASRHLERGWMTIEEACAGAVVMSDNTAANLLLDVQGGPEAFTRFLRANGDGVTRLDRCEIELNDVPPGDERDTTTPEAMVRTMRRFLLEDGVLSPAHRQMLIGWMVESPTGRERLRSGFPGNWRVGDKTGTWTAEHNATNDVAIAWPLDGRPIVIASYLSASTADAEARNAAHAEIARIVTEEWG